MLYTTTFMPQETIFAGISPGHLTERMETWTILIMEEDIFVLLVVNADASVSG